MILRQSGWADRAKRSRAYAGLFLLFLAFGLLVGFPIGRSLFPASRFSEGERIGMQTPAAQPANGQASWLILGVDDLEANSPQLKAAWLGLFFPGKPAVTLLPVYPTPGGPALEDSFSLDQEGVPKAEFTQALHEKRLWWTGFIVLDAEGLAMLLDFLAGRDARNVQEAVPQNFARSLDQEGDALTIQRSQTGMLAAACQLANGLLGSEDAQGMVAQLSPHLRTDLDLVSLARAWPVSGAGKLILDCEFPILAVSR